MGKAAFLSAIVKAKSRPRCKDEIGEDEYATFKKLDLGDFIGVRGPLFRTKTGEVTVRAKEYRLVSRPFVHYQKSGMGSVIVIKFTASAIST